MTQTETTTNDAAPSSNNAHSTSPLILFLIVLVSAVIYYVDWLNGFSTSWAFLVTTYLTLALAIAFIIFLHSQHNLRVFFMLAIKYIVVTLLLAIILPRVLLWVLNTIMRESVFADLSATLLALFPPLILYLIFDPDFGFEDNDLIRKIAAAWIAIFFIILIAATLGSYTFPMPDNYSGFDTRQGFMNAWSVIWDGLKLTIDRVRDGIGESIDMFRPEYYLGQVERGELDAELGVRLENVAPLDPFFLRTQNATISGFISAKSFLDDSILVAITCQLTSSPHTVAYVPEQFEVFRGADALFNCQFPPIDRTGSFNVRVSGIFNYDTWAYIDYDFVFDEKLRDFARQGRNIYQELDIVQEPRAIYTQGPVRLGMGGSRMPIRVINEPPYLENAFIGFNLDSRWERGELHRVNSLELIIPMGFNVESCDRQDAIIEGPIPDQNVLDARGQPLYNKFTFTNPDDSQQAFRSVRCRLGLDSLDVLPDIIEADKATRTFIVAASYTYIIHENTRITIRD